MKKELKLVIIDKNYCDYLRKYDKKVPYNFDKKQNRPFVGVLFKIGNINYYAPLSSPKPKHLKMHNSIDFLKLDNGKMGAINFNNMIPVLERNIKYINIQELFLSKDEYQILLRKQHRWLNRHTYLILKKSIHLYELYTANKLPKKLADRCCNFKLLEEKCMEYNQVSV